MNKLMLLLAGIAAVLGIGLSTPVAHADPMQLCEVGGPTPCYCPDGSGSVRLNPWAMCQSTLYGGWRSDAVAQRDD